MKILIDYLDKNNIFYTEKQIKQFEQYMIGILEWNEKVNLTAIKDREEFIKKHYIDSLLCYNMKEYQESSKIIDVGTGGGFPGIPLAIINPNKEFILMDSLNKRLKIIEELAEKCEIKNIKVLHGRAEDIGQNKKFREKFDLVISRAVARTNILSELAIPLVKENGYFLAYKGPSIEEELENSKNAINKLGGMIKKIENIEYKEFQHNIVVIKKIGQTPKKYPRQAGTPSKKPL